MRARLVVLGLGAAWAVLAGVAAPWLIRLGHAGEGPGILNDVFAGRSTHPLEFYLDKWTRIAVPATASLLVAGGLAYVLWRDPERSRSWMRRALGGSPVLAPRDVPWVGAALGAAGGLVEGFAYAGRHLVLHRPAENFYWEALWLAPLSALLVALFVSAGLAVSARLLRAEIGLVKVTGLFFVAAVCGVLECVMPRLHPAASVVLGVGVGVSVARLVARRVQDTTRVASLSRRGLAGLAAVLTVHAALLHPAVAELRSPQVPPDRTRSSPNVLLVVLDTVRAASLGFHGYERDTMPALGAWAASGVVFERAYSTAPWTLPSHATLFTGRYPHETRTGPDAPLDGTFPTLAEVFRDHGYATGGFVGNLGYTSRQSGLSRGFARYEDRRLTPLHLLSSSWPARALATVLLPAVELPDDNRVRGDRITEAFLRWAGGAEGRPFFAFLNYFDAHAPYVAPDPHGTTYGARPQEGYYAFAGRWPDGYRGPSDRGMVQPWINMYDGAIRYLDAQMAALREGLAAQGLLDDTIVVVTSDHGELWGERGQLHHSWSLYGPVLHVPLVVVRPGGVPAGARVSTDVTLRDVPSTILDLAGLSSGSPIPGESLAGTWDPAKPFEGRSPVLSQAELEPISDPASWAPILRGDMNSLVEGGTHWIRNGDGVEELYDLLRDAELLRDLSGAPDRATSIQRFRERFTGLAVPTEE